MLTAKGGEKVVFHITDNILIIFKIIKKNMSFNYLVLFQKRLMIWNSLSQLLCSIKHFYETIVSSQRIIQFINPNECVKLSLT